MELNLQNTLRKFIWGYLKNKKLYLFSFFLVAIIYAAEMSISPYLLKIIIDEVVVSGSTGNSGELLSAVFVPVILYILMSLVLNLNFSLYDYVNMRLYPRLKADIMKDMYSYLLGHSHLFFQNSLSGSLSKKIFDMATNIELMIRMVNQSFFPVMCALIISSYTLLMVVHQIFAIILIIWSIFFISLSYLASKKLEIHSKDLAESNVKVSGRISDSVANVTTVKLFSAGDYEKETINLSLEDIVNKDFKLYWQNMKINFAQGIGITFLTFLMITTLIYGRIQGWVTVGDFALVLTLSISVLNQIYNVGQQIQQFAKMTGVCREALSIIEAPHEIVNSLTAKKLQVKSGLIQFQNVNFRYKDKKILFNNLNIKINPGEKVALVGYSGSGKSTFIKLILRLMEVQSGSILIDNQDITKVTLESLLRSITVISQDPDMFHRSIMENIRFARPEASHNEVIVAATKARCNEFISKLPEGYKSVIGERGVNLSGGQRQMIAIARAFIRNSPILLLDEVTSSIDSITEGYIQKSLHNLMKNRTSIFIAHRLSTLKNMDRILVFDNGAIVEDGSLTSLLKNKQGIFYKLWTKQLIK